MAQPAYVALLISLVPLACRVTPTSSPLAEPVKAAQAKPATDAACLFGTSLSELDVSPLFKSSSRGQEQLPSRREGADARPRLYAMTDFRQTATGELYTAFSTFRDEDDGGLTTGWIERAAGGEVVAEIDDGSVVKCKLIDHRKSVPLPHSDCPFGGNFKTLSASSDFEATAKDDAMRASRLPGAGAQPLRFHVKELKHRANLQSFTAYYRGDDAESGWIEAQKTGELVAEIGDSEIFNCKVTSADRRPALVASTQTSCKFGADVHDIDASNAFSVVKEREVSRLPRGGVKDEKPRLFSAKELKHGPTGKVFVVYRTYEAENGGGEAFGWIEAAGGGEVVAEIDDSAIYNCKF